MKITIEIDPTAAASKPQITARDVSFGPGGAPVPSTQLVSADDVTIVGNSGVTPLSVAIPCVAAASINSDGTIATEAGVKSVNHSGTGTYIVTLYNPTLGAVPQVTCQGATGAPGALLNIDGTITVSTVNTSNVATDLHFYLTVHKA